MKPAAEAIIQRLCVLISMHAELNAETDQLDWTIKVNPVSSE